MNKKRDKLTLNEKLTIKKLIVQDKYSYSQLARMFNVGKTTISRIAHNYDLNVNLKAETYHKTLTNQIYIKRVSITDNSPIVVLYMEKNILKVLNSWRAFKDNLNTQSIRYEFCERHEFETALTTFLNANNLTQHILAKV